MLIFVVEHETKPLGSAFGVLLWELCAQHFISSHLAAGRDKGGSVFNARCNSALEVRLIQNNTPLSSGIPLASRCFFECAFCFHFFVLLLHFCLCVSVGRYYTGIKCENAQHSAFNTLYFVCAHACRFEKARNELKWYC